MGPTVWFENSHYEKLRLSLQVACSAQPVIRFRPCFKPKTWASDPFLLFQNSIRYEINDLFVMLRNAAFHVDMLQLAHCTALEKWIAEFGQMVVLYFSVQERVILPEINSLQSRICSVRQHRLRTFPLIQKLVSVHAMALKLASACRYREETGFVHANENLYKSLQSLSELVFDFAVHCEKFFSWELEGFVPLLERRTRTWTRDLEKRCIHELLTYDDGKHVFGGYASHLPTHVRDFYFQGVDVLKLRRIRAKERRWCRKHKAFRTRFAVVKTR